MISCHIRSTRTMSVLILLMAITLFLSEVNAQSPKLAKSPEPTKTAIPAARQPLSFRDMGVYGGWNEYWLGDACPFNFFIVQAVIEGNKPISSHGQSKSDWGQWLLRARTKGKRVVADVMVRGWPEAKDPVAHFKKGLDEFMAGVDSKQLYAITLGEENVFWNDHERMLKEIYAYAKSKYDVPVYQWFSPYASAPGYGWPHLPADGWITDEYARNGPSYEEFIRSYSIHQLPLIQIVWAAPLMQDFDWEKAGDPAFDLQVAVGRKYDVPTSFFAWEGHGNVWGWSPDALPLSKSVYSRALEWNRRAAATDRKPYEKLWDEGPSLSAQPFIYRADKTAAFKEDFVIGGGLTAKGAVTQGFRDVRWNGGPLELCPRQTGPAKAQLLYPLHSQFPLKGVEVQVAGLAIAGLKGSITVSVSADGERWMPERAFPASGELTLAVASEAITDGGTDVWVRVTLQGTARKVGDVPVTLRRIQVTGTIVEPAVREIVLRSPSAIPLRWDADMNGSLPFTSEIDNAVQLESAPGSIGTHGVEGLTNIVTVRQKLSFPDGLDLRKVTSRNWADQIDYGATNKLGVSLDGKNLLSEQSTIGVAKDSELILDLATDARFRNIKSFWVHLTMTNASGVKSGTSNRITALRVEGLGAADKK